MNWLGIDVGGANLKISDAKQLATTVPFPMWSDNERLEAKLTQLIEDAISLSNSREPPKNLAVTMTGELADCFESKQAGVAFIVDAVERVSTECDLTTTKYYTVDGLWLDADSAKRKWIDVAAANWAAMANFVGVKFEPTFERGCLIDIGSTTTDIIPIVDGKQSATGRTDTTRLANHELVYAGVGRTPISMLVNEFEFPSRSVSVAREVFATIKDALVVLGRVEESQTDLQTPDGRPLSPACCRHRLARTVCADLDELSETEIQSIAFQAFDETRTLIGQRLGLLVEHQKLNEHFLVSGEGDWLAVEIIKQRFPDAKVENMSSLLSPELSRCGPAVAVAYLANAEFTK